MAGKATGINGDMTPSRVLQRVPRLRADPRTRCIAHHGGRRHLTNGGYCVEASSLWSSYRPTSTQRSEFGAEQSVRHIRAWALADRSGKMLTCLNRLAHPRVGLAPQWTLRLPCRGLYEKSAIKPARTSPSAMCTALPRTWKARRSVLFQRWIHQHKQQARKWMAGRSLLRTPSGTAACSC